MKKIMKVIAIMMLMVMVLTGATPTVTEAKNTKTSITVTNKSTDKKIGKKLTLTQGKKLQLKVKYGKTNVTKKAKYKASNKNVTISKKGKITAKKVGTTTVTIKYKKKTKKIKVTVKAKVVQTTTEQATTEKTKQKHDEDNVISSEDVAEAARQKRAQCEHEWGMPTFYSDIEFPDEQLHEMYKDHLFLWGVGCSKCGEYRRTTAVPVTEALNYTSADFAAIVSDKSISDVPCYGKGASHHHYVKLYSKTRHGWAIDIECINCGSAKSY